MSSGRCDPSMAGCDRGDQVGEKGGSTVMTGKEVKMLRSHNVKGRGENNKTLDRPSFKKQRVSGEEEDEL